MTEHTSSSMKKILKKQRETNYRNKSILRIQRFIQPHNEMYWRSN